METNHRKYLIPQMTYKTPLEDGWNEKILVNFGKGNYQYPMITLRDGKQENTNLVCEGS